MVLVRFFQRKNSQSYRRNKSTIFCFSLGKKSAATEKKKFKLIVEQGFFGFNLRTYQRLYWTFFSYHLNLEKQFFLMVLVRFFQHKNSQSNIRKNIDLCPSDISCKFLLSAEQKQERLENKENRKKGKIGIWITPFGLFVCPSGVVFVA